MTCWAAAATTAQCRGRAWCITLTVCNENIVRASKYGVVSHCKTSSTAYGLDQHTQTNITHHIKQPGVLTNTTLAAASSLHPTLTTGARQFVVQLAAVTMSSTSGLYRCCGSTHRVTSMSHHQQKQICHTNRFVTQRGLHRHRLMICQLHLV
jgi:hypothetical protein